METNTQDLTKGYKGYNSDFTCNPQLTPYQYAENTIHELRKYEELKCCETGFHYCVNPLDILKFYSLIGDNGKLNILTRVEALGDIDTDDDCIKCATNKIKIGDKLSLEEYVDECIEYMSENCKCEDDDYFQVATSGYLSQIATSGDNSQIAVSGDGSQVATSGYYSKIVTSGDSSQVTTNGDGSQIATSGDSSQVATSGEYSQIATSGNNSQVATSGYYSQLATSGDNSKVATSGDCSKVVASGDNSQLATSGNFSSVAISGNCSQVATSGEDSHVATSGYKSHVVASGYRSNVSVHGGNSQVFASGEESKAFASGYCSRVNVQGDKSVGVNIGIDGAIKGVLGTWITLAEYKQNTSECICVKSAIIDGVILKADTWYTLKDGEFVEC